MAEVLQHADLVVSSAGSTVWECLALGVPLVTMILAENQNDNATYLSETGIATTARSCRGEGFLDSLSQQVRASVANPVQAFANADKGRNLIDGKGAFRIIDRLT
jgi:spore coat polysaccharide biosynthesis predicted glycosyltransferase SpsG